MYTGRLLDNWSSGVHHRAAGYGTVVETTLARDYRRCLALLHSKGLLLEQLAEADARLAEQDFRAANGATPEQRGKSGWSRRARGWRLQ